MEHLWAGWRSRYVAGADDGPNVPGGEGSVFTRILTSGLPDETTHIVWRGVHVFSILNAFPYTTGHLMVMPYREVADLELLTADESSELWAGVNMAVLAVKAAYRPEGVNVGINLGRAGGAGVPTHLHCHVLPRWAGDTNFMTSIAEVRVMPEELRDTAVKVRASWPQPAGR